MSSKPASGIRFMGGSIYTVTNTPTVQGAVQVPVPSITFSTTTTTVNNSTITTTATVLAPQ